MNKTPFIYLALALLAVELSTMENTIDTLKKNLDTLAKRDEEHKDCVEIKLTESEKIVKFGRLCGNWGLISSDGNWFDFGNVPTCVVEEVADYVQRVVNNL